MKKKMHSLLRGNDILEKEDMVLVDELIFILTGKLDNRVNG